MVYTPPSGYTAGRDMVLGGKKYKAGDALPVHEVAQIRSLNVLLSTRRIVPVYDSPSRTVESNATRTGPMYVPPGVRTVQAVQPEPPKKRAAKRTAVKPEAVEAVEETSDVTDAG